LTVEELIEKCLKNNREAQKELYNTYKDKLFVLCLKYCANREDAQDVLQDAFVEIFQNISNYQNKGSFEGWIKKIAINQSITKYKKSIKNVSMDTDFKEEVEIELDVLKITSEEILKAIQELPNQYRLVFNLYFLDELSHKEIAEMLHISEGTSKSNLHRAKQILQNKFNYLKK
jgi:RNA polymerase sigma-70 factor (ECF subfamily)